MIKKSEVPDKALVDLDYDNYFGQPWEDPMDGTIGEVCCSFGFGGDDPCGDYYGREGIEECDFHCPFNFIKDLHKTHNYMKNPWNTWKYRIKKLLHLKLNYREQEHEEEQEYWKQRGER